MGERREFDSLSRAEDAELDILDKALT